MSELVNVCVKEHETCKAVIIIKNYYGNKKTSYDLEVVNEALGKVTTITKRRQRIW